MPTGPMGASFMALSVHTATLSLRRHGLVKSGKKLIQAVYTSAQILWSAMVLYARLQCVLDAGTKFCLNAMVLANKMLR